MGEPKDDPGVEPDVDERADDAADGEASAAEGSDGDGDAITDSERRSRLESIVESMLFAAGQPVSVRQLVQLLDGPTAKEINAAVGALTEYYDRKDRGLRLVAVAGGYQFRTAPENVEFVRALLKEKPARLGRASLETLAIIAYRQPVTKAEIEAIRGVDVDSALGSLLARKLIRIEGRKEVVGRPLLYGTTPEFLEVFGLKNLRELPALKEIGPVPEPDEPPSDDDTDATDFGGAIAEDPEPRRDHLAPQGGDVDPGGPGGGEREGGDEPGRPGDGGA